jgi:transmembrane sensor
MSAPAPSLSERIDEQAARWTARLDGGKMTPADRLALHAWLDEDAAHRTAFEHYQLICDDTAESLPALAQVSAVASPDATPSRSWPRWIPAAAGLAAALVVAALWLVPYFRDTQTVATVAAQRSTLSLPDGSRLDLNAQTTLHTDFRHGERRVRLEKGEAYFSVAKDAAHPFLVETPGGTVRVTGTEFNVRLAAGRPEVTLLEGSVGFENAAARVKLVPGDQLSADGDLHHLADAELGNVTAWRQGRIVLNGLTLAEAAARFAEFHGKVITVAPELAVMRMGGSYSLDDLPGFFDALSDERLALHVIRRDTDNYAIVRK